MPSARPPVKRGGLAQDGIGDFEARLDVHQRVGCSGYSNGEPPSPCLSPNSMYNSGIEKDGIGRKAAVEGVNVRDASVASESP